jgi:hypothetical protein
VPILLVGLRGLKIDTLPRDRPRPGPPRPSH